jgi:hypothetical protein
MRATSARASSWLLSSAVSSADSPGARSAPSPRRITDPCTPKRGSAISRCRVLSGTMAASQMARPLPTRSAR